MVENPNNLGASAYRLFKATEHTDLLWELFDFLAQVSIFVTLTSIAVSAQSVTRGGPNGFGRLLRLGTFVVAAVVVALAFAVYGLRVASLESGGTVYNWNLYDHADRAAASASILNWIMSLYNCGLAVLAMGSGTGKGVRSAGILDCFPIADILSDLLPPRVCQLLQHHRHHVEHGLLHPLAPQLQHLAGLYRHSPCCAADVDVSRGTAALLCHLHKESWRYLDRRSVWEDRSGSERASSWPYELLEVGS
jgi:hypothetical protein